MSVVRSDPPRRRGGNSTGRPVSKKLVDAMTVVAANPDNWYQVDQFASRGSASSAANRMRKRDWEATLRLRAKVAYEWDIVSRTMADGSAGVWARRRRA